MLNRIIIAVCIACAAAGGGYGLWQGRAVARQAQELIKLGQVVEQQASALKAAEARARASAKAAKARRVIQQEQEVAVVKDRDAVSRNPEWASQPVPADIAQRLLND